jgi:hypothetical protein
VVLRGYMDESYDNSQRLFTYSCLTATGKDWREMERVWKLHLNAKNRELKRSGRQTISRYHASDCSGRRNEFEGWTHDERDAFVIGLFGIFKRIPVHAVAIDIDLDELYEVFPEWASSDRLGHAYWVLTKFVMNTIGDDFDTFADGNVTPGKHKITLFHDRTGGNGRYDPVILRSFNGQVADPNYEHTHYFTTIAPLGWEDCVALQPADLVAFEMFKEAELRLKNLKPRKAFSALLDNRSFGIHKKSFTKAAIEHMREQILARQAAPPNWNNLA